MYKLICIDMDGTLLNEKGEVSERNKKALKAAYDKGVKIAITTGRIFQCAKFYAKDMKIEGIIISTNGAYIGLEGHEEPIYKSIMTKIQLETFYNLVKKYDLITYFFTTQGVVADKKFPPDHPYILLNQSLEEKEKISLDKVQDFKEAFETYEGQFLKAICIENTEKWKLQELRKELEKEDLFEVVASWDNNIEIMAKGTSKGNAAHQLANHFNLLAEEVICIGDSENDLSMIEYAGLGIAMGNAIPQVKEAADYITASYTESGVAQAIEKFVLQ